MNLPIFFTKMKRKYLQQKIKVNIRFETLLIEPPVFLMNWVNSKLFWVVMTIQATIYVALSQGLQSPPDATDIKPSLSTSPSS